MGNSVLRRLRYWAGSLKLRLALASFVLIASSVAVTVVLVLRDMEERSQRAVRPGSHRKLTPYLLSGTALQRQGDTHD